MDGTAAPPFVSALARSNERPGRGNASACRAAESRAKAGTFHAPVGAERAPSGSYPARSSTGPVGGNCTPTAAAAAKGWAVSGDRMKTWPASVSTTYSMPRPT